MLAFGLSVRKVQGLALGFTPLHTWTEVDQRFQKNTQLGRLSESKLTELRSIGTKLLH